MQATLIDRRYFVVELLGRGGMAEVYLARDEVLGRAIALKILKREYAALEEFRKRMWREAKSAASLSHPNIVRVYDRGETEDGLPYIAMEHLKGGTLAEKIRREGALAWREAAWIATQVALALAEAHRHGVVHRDIKPHNLFLTGDPLTVAGSVKVGDFGIARAAAANTLTETSMILGTTHYLSPEQAKGESAGPESDLYSLGVTLYQMLSGRVPFEAESPVAIAMKHISEVACSPKEMNPDVSEDLAAVALLLLSKDPLARYGGDALALADDLERMCRGLKPLYRGGGISPETLIESLGAPPVSLRRERRARRHFKKRRVVGAATAAVLTLGLTLGGAYSYGLYKLPLSTNAAAEREIAPAAPSSLGSVEVPSLPEEPQDKTSIAYKAPVQEELPAAAPAMVQPVAYTAPVQENPAPVQEELPAAIPAVVEQEAEPVVVQEEEPPVPISTVREKKTQTEPPKKPAVVRVASTAEDEKPESKQAQEQKEEQKEKAEERAKDAKKAAKKAEEEAREAQEEAVKEAKERAEEAAEEAQEKAKERAEKAAERAQEKAKESAKKRHNGR